MRKHYVFWYALLAAITLVAALFPAGLSGRSSLLQLVVAVVVAIVLPPVLIWLAQKLGYPLGQPVHCSRCQTELPLLRKPTSVRQGLLGGYDCPNCGASLDARGREVLANQPR
ncbi:MAG: hypothetical protein KIT36_24015 [Alphaproteobacteria bacterium]|nr:hypothetical protein [Alphaproteobacteria bacterium]